MRLGVCSDLCGPDAHFARLLLFIVSRKYICALPASHAANFTLGLYLQLLLNSRLQIFPKGAPPPWNTSEALGEFSAEL